MSLPSTTDIKPARFNFEDVSLDRIEKVLSTGTLDALPEAERRYYDLMEMVRGLRARVKINDKLVTKAGIIRLLKSQPYGLTDYMARRVYTDAINFFWAQDVLVVGTHLELLIHHDHCLLCKGSGVIGGEIHLWEQLS